jgi:hypothetical protein
VDYPRGRHGVQETRKNESLTLQNASTNECGRRELDLLLNALYHSPVSRLVDREDRDAWRSAINRTPTPRRQPVPFPASLPINQDNHRMRRLTPLSCRTSNIALLAFIALACAQSNVVGATNVPAGPASLPQALTQFEFFIQTNCVPCVREFYTIATVPFPSVKTPSFAGLAPANPAPNTRAGEMRLELLRAYPVGQQSRQHLAMRVVLSVSAGSASTLYPLGAGLLDEDEVPVLAASLSEMGKSMSNAGDNSSIPLIDTEFHADSVRMGIVRTGKDALGYVQIAPADPLFALKQVWELPAMYLPAEDIATIEHAVQQVNAKIQAFRGR